MEDYVVIAVLDLEATSERAVEKKNLQCYIMLGSECIDNLNLGSLNAQLQPN